jgi:hypothetical protein
MTELQTDVKKHAACCNAAWCLTMHTIAFCAGLDHNTPCVMTLINVLNKTTAVPPLVETCLTVPHGELQTTRGTRVLQACAPSFT